ncbi:MAG: hypothetical protein KBH12_03080 [Synergistaceae bacterium]|jgi:hypothetical protein|nr:hypothetical protein [Synergistaceae bacterium]MBP9625816.1 hypothetical protein [Synergistaceae bacterium]MBP9956926.1 hypothetical protein [Synergistaceae bacterium]
MDRLRFLFVLMLCTLLCAPLSGKAFADQTIAVSPLSAEVLPSADITELDADGSDAKEAREPRLFFLSPSFGWYFPTDGKTKDAFGDSWSAFGVSLNLGALTGKSLVVRTGNVELRPFFGYISGEQGDNDVKIIPIGLESRWNLYSNDTVRFYTGLGVSMNLMKFDIADSNIDTSWRGAIGGRVMIGADVTKWLNLQAAYNLINVSRVEGYNFNGFSLRARINLYF